jgi:hypothetical protein
MHYNQCLAQKLAGNNIYDALHKNTNLQDMVAIFVGGDYFDCFSVTIAWVLGVYRVNY